MNIVDQIEDALQRADRTYADGRAALVQPDGRPLYMPDEQERREAAIRDQYAAAIAQAAERVDTFRAEAQREAAQANTDPAAALSTADLQRAEAMRAFIAEDAERLPLPDVGARIASALAAQDRVLSFLWERYANRRLEALQKPDAARTLSPADQAAIRALREQIQALRVLVEGSERIRRREQAQAALKQAELAAIRVNRRKLAMQPRRTPVAF